MRSELETLRKYWALLCQEEKTTPDTVLVVLNPSRPNKYKRTYDALMANYRKGQNRIENKTSQKANR